MYICMSVDMYMFMCMFMHMYMYMYTYRYRYMYMYMYMLMLYLWIHRVLYRVKAFRVSKGLVLLGILSERVSSLGFSVLSLVLYGLL